MKNKKIWIILLIGIFFWLIGTIHVNADIEISSMNQLADSLGQENVSIEGDTIKLQNDIILQDGIVIHNGNYVIDLNGKTITYPYKAYKVITTIEGNQGTTSIVPSEMLTAVFRVEGGNVIFKDSIGAGKINTNNNAIEVSEGSVRIENGHYTGSVYVYGQGRLNILDGLFYHSSEHISIATTQNGSIQIDGGKFIKCNISGTGSLTINQGTFFGQIIVDVVPYSNNPNIRIHGGTFMCKDAPALVVSRCGLLSNTIISGGTFLAIGQENAGAIDVLSETGEAYNLNNLLAEGYQWNHPEQNVTTIDFLEGFHDPEKVYLTTSANKVRAIKENETSEEEFFILFLDQENQAFDIQKCLTGQSVINTKVPEREGYRFNSWDSDLNNIYTDMIVKPIYDKILKFDVKDIARQEYTGTTIIPNLEVYDTETKQILQQGKDYEVTCFNNINAGQANISIKGMGDYQYADIIQKEFIIKPKELLYSDIEMNALENQTCVYNGQVIIPQIEIKCNHIKLIEGKDYQVKGNSIKAGPAIIDIEGIGNYCGKVFFNFKITPKDLKDENIQVDTSDKIYTGNEIRPEVWIKDGNTVLTKNKDYLVYYQNNYTVGTATLKIVGYGNYTGTFIKTFNIVKLEKDINQISTINIDTSDKFYTGKAIETSTELIDGNTPLVKGRDYLVTYSNNCNEGIATIKINGIGNYKGEIVKNFQIIRIDLNNISSNIDVVDKLYTGSAIEPKVVLKDGNQILEKGKDYDVYYMNNIAEGTATIKIIGKGLYKNELIRTFQIVKKDINKVSTISIDTSNKEYTGSEIKTSVSLKDAGTTLVNGKDYEVRYTNNKNYGTATISIVGKGVYKGTITKTFKIIPRKISITKLKNTILRCVVINWSKNTTVSGYEIYRATSANGNYANVKTISRNSTASHTFIAQAKGTYYYKIRSYVIVNGAKIYSEFSDIQSVKVTK